jgi:hypothetical protein
MRLVFTIVLTCVTISSSLNAQVIQPTPDPNDRVGWAGFCLGFYSEVSRQAINDNNNLLYTKAQANIASYWDEVSVMIVSGLTDPGATWSERGGRAAGKQYWDIAPMIDTPGQTSTRTEIMALRSRYAQSCDTMALQSSAYHEQAEAVRRKLAAQNAQAVRPLSDPTRKQKPKPPG